MSQAPVQRLGRQQCLGEPLPARQGHCPGIGAWSLQARSDTVEAKGERQVFICSLLVSKGVRTEGRQGWGWGMGGGHSPR